MGRELTLEDIIVRCPQDSFIAKYIDLMSVLETPLVYDLWCAMFCLSNAVTRQAVVDRPRAPVRLNLYIILTAESGVTRKSTAVNTAMRVMEKFNDRINGQIEVIHTKATPERLEELLSARSTQFQYCHYTFIVSELVTALGSERYNLAMPGLLTDLFDSPDIRKTPGTVKGGSRTLHNVYGTFLSASTPTWLTRAINPDVIEGGFTSRVFFVVSEQPKQRVAWPKEREESAEDLLAEQLVEIYRQFVPEDRRDKGAKHERPFVLSDDARRAFEGWYSSRELGVDPFTTSFDAREDGHILKVAALLAINSGCGIINDVHLHDAIFLVQRTVKAQAVELLAYQSNNEIIDAVDKLRNLLVTNPKGIKHSQVVKFMHATAKAKRVNIILDMMHELQMVKKFAYTHHAQGRPGVAWVPMDALKNHDYLAILLDNLVGKL